VLPAGVSFETKASKLPDAPSISPTLLKSVESVKPVT
jgi:hypothetical protein